ncbi:MAG TPA: LysM peptidoglycan-binding domain-containing protein, partial [Pirellulales bacterium]
YLGSAEYWQALYAYNRDVLKDPEVLPIGAELRIPPKYILPAIGANSVNGSAVPALSTGGINVGNPASPGQVAPAAVLPLMVNVPPSPQKISFNSTVAKTAPTGRTYTVQAGESLLDVARKVYGDPRRYQDLFEANRRQLRTPGDLKTGMVLTIP